ncbi:MAG: glucose-1-phosphate adenylyltransferase subunit GlgD [Bacilli bacterium]|nr:glucose-1-phosphate adenylyltransferase subunit GlgD [Bacilli bacterium]
MKNVIGLVNLHSGPDLAPLTDSRPLASTSFLGRYAVIDFHLSNLCNAGISTVGILVKDHLRSVLKHLGNMSSWVTNTKIGRNVIMYNESAHNTDIENNDLNNIRWNDWALYDSNADYIVIVPGHIIAPIDIKPIVEEHIDRGARITVVATKVNDASKEYRSEMILRVNSQGTLDDAYANDGKTVGPATVGMGIYVINRTVFADMIHNFSRVNNSIDLKTLIYQVALEGNYKIYTHLYEGYSRCIDSFEHYIEYSFELLDRKTRDQLFLEDLPFYTLTQDTAPAVYGEGAHCQNSFISNGALVEGTVINSIIGRNVKIGKGAVVRDSIVFSNTSVGENAVVDHALLDKRVIITRNHKVVGSADKTEYVFQGAIL